jgi:predicted metalloprotease with PDZ domain
MTRILLIFLTLISFKIAAENTGAIEYNLSITDAAHHLANVSVTFPKVTSKTLYLKLPVWRSGRYEILNLSKAVSSFSALHENGQDIEWEKTDKSTWKLSLNQPGSVTVSYQIYANTLQQRVVHIDSTHAFLDASGVFMFSPAFRDQALSVKLDVADNWQSRSGMEKTAKHSFVAADYDQLVDSPIETGIHEFLSFELEDKTYEIVIWGKGNHDINDLKEQITLLHFEAKKIWQTFPFDRYVYMYHSGDDIGGATEHVNSTIIQQRRFNFKPRKSYLKVLATTAHEFIHTWNVKAYRPSGIAPYDYSKENYSDLYWMAEGITSYYHSLLLMRAGIYKPKEFLAKLSENIENHLDKPGRKVESLAQTSFDTWLKDDAQQRHNAAVSIYLEGSLVAWRMDQEIRKLTDNKYGLDQLQKRLYQQHHNTDQGYQKEDVLDSLQETTGSDMTLFWQEYVEGTKAIDFDQLLDFYGLQKTAKAQKDETVESSWIGASLNSEQQLIRIKTVDTDSPAWQAGLTMGDQLLSIDGIKLTQSNFINRIAQLTAGQSYEVHYFTAGRLMSTELTPIINSNPAFNIAALAKPSRKQKARFKAWSGQDLKEK